MGAPEPDWRLRQLERRLERVEPVVTDVAVMRSEMAGLTRELQANTRATAEVADQLEKAQVGTMVKQRAFWSQVTLVILGAVIAGAFAVLAALIASGAI